MNLIQLFVISTIGILIFIIFWIIYGLNYQYTNVEKEQEQKVMFILRCSISTNIFELTFKTASKKIKFVIKISINLDQ